MGLIDLHGGPDALGVPRWDFSTNANACGPEPGALQAVRLADASRYPDPGYQALRIALGDLHGVPARRIVVAASASEFIVRMTHAVARGRPEASVCAPRPGYADYARAAAAAGLACTTACAEAGLVWHTEPGSPDGVSTEAPLALRPGAVLVVDRAYAPLRLSGREPTLPDAAWQLWSPNKALGLAGVRGAYAIAPASAHALQDELMALAPSWPLGAHAVAMLEAWTQPASQAWVQASLATLRDWKAQQLEQCRALGWRCRSGDTPFFVAHWGGPDGEGVEPPAVLLPRLRARGLKLRDTTSLGLPGHVRVSVQPPEAQRALVQAWQHATLPERSST